MTDGYTLLSATLEFATVINASAVTVSIRSEATNQPGSTDLATLTGTPAGRPADVQLLRLGLQPVRQHDLLRVRGRQQRRHHPEQHGQRQ